MVKGCFWVSGRNEKRGGWVKPVSILVQQSYAQTHFFYRSLTDPYDLVNYLNEATIRTSGQPI